MRVVGRNLFASLLMRGLWRCVGAWAGQKDGVGNGSADWSDWQCGSNAWNNNGDLIEEKHKNVIAGLVSLS